MIHGDLDATASGGVVIFLELGRADALGAALRDALADSATTVGVLRERYAAEGLEAVLIQPDQRRSTDATPAPDA